MKKSLNQRIFEEVLEVKFPGEFRYQRYKESDLYMGKDTPENVSGKAFDISLQDAFWLAEKVGLFQEHSISQFSLGEGKLVWKIRTNHEDSVKRPVFADSVTEAIGLAVLEIYGSKR